MGGSSNVGAGGSDANGGTAGDVATNSGGTGGSPDGGTGGESPTTTGNTMGGTGGNGGTGGIGGTGGTGGTGGGPSSCSVVLTENISSNTGALPSRLSFSNGASSLDWSATWPEANDVMYASFTYKDSDQALDTVSPELSVATGDGSLPALASRGTYALIGHGTATGPAAILHRLNIVNAAGSPTQGATDALTSSGAPDVTGIAFNSTDSLIAGIETSGKGMLALFDETTFVDMANLGNAITSIDAAYLGSSYAVALVEDGALQIAIASDDLSTVSDPEDFANAAPLANGPGHAIQLAQFETGALLVWVENNGVYLTTLSGSGVPGAPVRVSNGSNDLYPRVDYLLDWIVVSWLDANKEALYFRRLPLDLSGAGEAPLQVARYVAEGEFGFSADRLHDVRTLGLTYSTNRLKLSIVTCDD